MATTTRTVNGANVTYTISLTALTAKGDLLAGEASEQIYAQYSDLWIYDNGNKVEWDNLTNAQKINLLGNFTQLILKRLAHTQYRNDTLNAVSLNTEDERYNGS